MLCIDEVYDRVRWPAGADLHLVDPLAGLTARIPLARADADSLAAAMAEVKALGAEPRVVVSGLSAAHPEALGQA